MNEDKIRFKASVQEIHLLGCEATKEPYYCPECGTQNVWSFVRLDGAKYGTVRAWSACLHTANWAVPIWPVLKP